MITRPNVKIIILVPVKRDRIFHLKVRTESYM